ncbi:hypothetical protein B7486_11125 [cyanobacterium TDX16]|nr:hypothetical protein B7486_11125 [cyanobacterium TDX16]
MQTANRFSIRSDVTLRVQRHREISTLIRENPHARYRREEAIPGLRGFSLIQIRVIGIVQTHRPG